MGACFDYTTFAASGEYKEQIAKVKKMEEKYKEINKKNKWVVGAWCAS